MKYASANKLYGKFGGTWGTRTDPLGPKTNLFISAALYGAVENRNTVT